MMNIRATGESLSHGLLFLPHRFNPHAVSPWPVVHFEQLPFGRDQDFRVLKRSSAVIVILPDDYDLSQSFNTMSLGVPSHLLRRINPRDSAFGVVAMNDEIPPALLLQAFHNKGE